jgi:hypothetical protein
MIYHFGECTLDTNLYSLQRGDQTIRMRVKVFRACLYLTVAASMIPPPSSALTAQGASARRLYIKFARALVSEQVDRRAPAQCLLGPVVCLPAQTPLCGSARRQPTDAGRSRLRQPACRPTLHRPGAQNRFGKITTQRAPVASPRPSCTA